MTTDLKKKDLLTVALLFLITPNITAQIPETPVAVRSIKTSFAKQGLIIYKFDSRTMEPLATIYQIHSSGDKKKVVYKTVRKLWHNNW
jgi:hypothetical protein